ncbi:single-stranded-DNA-specific exonuclease RecJ [Candidatus Daviesbacteria bacterium]|nr:single-stranded-DNA-specific exonuclease RecJ [Candidatus Daviesbacteria bacterium]
MHKEWKILPKKSDGLTEQFLSNRGIGTGQAREEFFKPALENYQQALEIPGIKKAQDRIKKAIEKNELIIIYGDYDVDGICASAILYKALTSIGAKVLPYIPHREKEGYGLSRLGLESAKQSGASLVITVDNGIVAIEEAKFAKESGLDLIITDHHLPLDEKPQAYSIVHSTKMCGAAVAWCLVCDRIRQDLKKDLLQFVAVATVCDLIPLVGLGRAYVVEGLKILNQTQNLGFLELIKQSGIESGHIGSYEIGHIIGPRINAIGRLEHAIDALRLLCTKDPAKAKSLAKLLNDKNSERQKLTIDGVEQAKILVNGNGNKKIYVLDSKNWSPGIIGLIAARICEEYYCPAIAISVGPTHSRGSARSIKGINIVGLIRECSDLLVGIGGHPGAAGFSILNENIPQFRKRLEELVEKIPKTETTLEIEAEIPVGQLTKSLVKEIEKFEPFGFGNPRPVLVTRAMRISEIRTVGGGKHLKLKADGIDAIGFGMGEMEKDLKQGQLLDVAYYLEINKFNGSETLQLKVKDVLF